MMIAMKKPLKLWMLLVITLSIVSCVDNSDNSGVDQGMRF